MVTRARFAAKVRKLNHNQKQLGYDVEKQPVLNAAKVKLGVLAPARFYKRCDLTALDAALNAALTEFPRRQDLELSFEFSRLGAAYQKGSVEGIGEAVEGRQRVWAD